MKTEQVICNQCNLPKEGRAEGLCNHCGRFGKTNRQLAMSWWNNLASLQKTQKCDTNTELLGSIRRWETLTGREIEKIFEDLKK
jgi:hypothetical protein